MQSASHKKPETKRINRKKIDREDGGGMHVISTSVTIARWAVCDAVKLAVETLALH